MEVMISMVVMAVVMLGLAYGYMIVQQRNMNELMRQKAEETIQSIFASLRAEDFDDLADQPGDLPDLELYETQNLNEYCDPDTGEVPANPLCSGNFVFRSASGAGSANTAYEVVYKLFDTVSDTGVELEGATTVVATICWKNKGVLKYLSRKSVIQEGGM